MEQITVDLTAEDAKHHESIVAYFRSGRFGIDISRDEEEFRYAPRGMSDENARAKSRRHRASCAHSCRSRRA